MRLQKKDSGLINWQPLSMLPALANAIDEMLCEADSQITNLKELEGKQQVPDDDFAERLISCYSNQKEDFQLYREQAVRWKKENNLTENQHQEIMRLESQLGILEDIISSILAVTDKLKK